MNKKQANVKIAYGLGYVQIMEMSEKNFEWLKGHIEADTGIIQYSANGIIYLIRPGKILTVEYLQ